MLIWASVPVIVQMWPSLASVPLLADSVPAAVSVRVSWAAASRPVACTVLAPNRSAVLPVLAEVISAGNDQVSTAALAGMAAVCSAVLAVWLKA